MSENYSKKTNVGCSNNFSDLGRHVLSLVASKYNFCKGYMFYHLVASKCCFWFLCLDFFRASRGTYFLKVLSFGVVIFFSNREWCKMCCRSCIKRYCSLKLLFTNFRFVFAIMKRINWEKSQKNLEQCWRTENIYSWALRLKNQKVISSRTSLEMLKQSEEVRHCERLKINGKETVNSSSLETDLLNLESSVLASRKFCEVPWDYTEESRDDRSHALQKSYSANRQKEEYNVSFPKDTGKKCGKQFFKFVSVFRRWNTSTLQKIKRQLNFVKVPEHSSRSVLRMLPSKKAIGAHKLRNAVLKNTGESLAKALNWSSKRSTQRSYPQSLEAGWSDPLESWQQTWRRFLPAHKPTLLYFQSFGETDF